MITVPSTRLHYDAKTKTFVGEVSETGFPGEELRIKSARSGRIESFRASRPERDRENEVVAYVYHNTRLGLTVRLFND
jgi:hypothetical protein